MPQPSMGVLRLGFSRPRPGCAASAAAHASARTADAVACPVSGIRAAGIPRAPGSCCRRTAPAARPVAGRALAPQRLPLPRAVGGSRSDPRRALGQACGSSMQTPCAAAARAGRLARRLRSGWAMLPCRARRRRLVLQRLDRLGSARHGCRFRRWRWLCIGISNGLVACQPMAVRRAWNWRNCRLGCCFGPIRSAPDVSPGPRSASISGLTLGRSTSSRHAAQRRPGCH